METSPGSKVGLALHPVLLQLLTEARIVDEVRQTALVVHQLVRDHVRPGGL